jgi:RNA-directed DNA polymerase
MKLEQAHIDQIRTAFEKMQSREDLLHVLNEAKPLVYGDKAVPFDLKQLTWYANPKLGRKRYAEFKIKKKSGAERCIHAPVKGLKSLQKTLSFVLQCVYEPHNAAMGFVRDRSIVDNAKLHVGSKYVYNIDLKDFFPSVDQARVWKCFQLKPFNLNKASSVEPQYMKWEDFKKEHLKTDEPVTFLKGKGRMFTNTPYGTLYVANNFDKEKDKYILLGSSSLKTKAGKSLEGTLWLVNKIPDTNRLDIANIIASLCCTEMEVERKNETGEWEKVKRNVLPQGAPTSPVITNIVCQKLDYLLSGVAKRFGLKYSRYADDITFSSMHNVYQPESVFLKELHRIIAEQNFYIKESKTRLQKDGYRKEVTGLLVNEKANVQQRYIKQLRMWLYYWERYGYERASGFFLQQYIADKGHVRNGKPDMANVISGKLDYLKMVKGADNELYQKLKTRFEKLTGKVASVSKNLIEIEEAEISNTPLMKLLLGLTEQPMVVSEEKIIDIPTKVKAEEKPIPVFHKPKELVALLKNFSVNDSALKYTTHSWDAGRDANMFKDLSEFLSIAKSQYSEFSYALKGLSENLNGKIYNFLFNKEIAKSGWGDINPKKRIYFGWSSPELLEACKNDISLNPEDFILPEKFQIQRSGKTLQKFKHIIDVFKNEIEVRDENSALLNLILQKHDNYLISFSAPKVSNLENKTFYTDIQWLGKALDLIFEGIQKYPQHPVVEYAVTENNNDRLVLTILHRNSFKNGLSIYDDKLNLKRGDFSTIKDKLQNLCDWSIESEFAEGAYRINYLVSDNENPAYEKIMSAEGFKHILTFYK